MFQVTWNGFNHRSDHYLGLFKHVRPLPKDTLSLKFDVKGRLSWPLRFFQCLLFWQFLHSSVGELSCVVVRVFPTDFSQISQAAQGSQSSRERRTKAKPTWHWSLSNLSLPPWTFVFSTLCSRHYYGVWRLNKEGSLSVWKNITKSC